MIDYIMSKDVKAYLEKIGHKFTDFEIAGLIYNSAYPIPEILESLKELSEKTDDENLKKQIAYRIERETKMLEMMTTEEPGYVYRVEKYDELIRDYFHISICNSYNNALKYATKFIKDTRFKIIKSPMISNPDILDSDHDYYDDNCGEIVYTKDGECDYWSHHMSEDDKAAPKGFPDLSRFENAFVAIPFPFRKGEKVKIAARRYTRESTGTIAELSDDNEMWDYLQRLTDRAENGHADESDMHVWLFFEDMDSEEEDPECVDPRDVEYM